MADKTSSTERATKAAAASSTDEIPADISTAKVNPELPTNGVLDGRFYFQKNIARSDAEEAEIPSQVHWDNVNEVRLHARNQGWETTEDSFLVDQAANQGDHWVVTYSIPVQRNG